VVITYAIQNTKEINKVLQYKHILQSTFSLKNISLKKFQVRCGLRQEDALSPTLFNLALEKVVRNFQDDREMELLWGTTFLAYVDDIMILG